MRLDKFLKVSRLIKRRTVANQACGGGRISVNGKPAKASCEVKIGDKISIETGEHVTVAEVLCVIENARKEQAQEMFRILDEK